MDKSNSEIPNELPLDRLVACAMVELKKLCYSRRTVRRYRMVWQQLSAFSQRSNLEDKYSRDLALRFEDAYRLRDGESIKSTDGWRRHLVFSIKVLDDFARTGRIERLRTEMQSLQVPAAMQKPLRDYEEYGRKRRHLRPPTLQDRIRLITAFLDFLGSRSVTTLEQMQPGDISAFITSRQRMRSKSMSRIVSDLRAFLQFLFLQDILPRDFSSVLPTIRVTRDATIPSVWDTELVVRLLKVVDRGSPRGKRDYAILLLACRLGMRLGDIRALTLDNLNWAAATIEITQSKTLAPLCLPLTEEVGEALIDYLKSGRPQTEHRQVFLRLKPPFTPFTLHNHLYNIVAHWRELAKIQFHTKQHQGLHSLRHYLPSLTMSCNLAGSAEMTGITGHIG
ncbi:MAG: tyrosine-type recombinase/integrase [Georgfuchsia sp.]